MSSHLHPKKSTSSLAWVISADMGYGHARAVDPLRHLSVKQKILNANNFPGISQKDQKIWRQSRHFYEFISRFKQIPLIGEYAFQLFDRLQEIPEFYPRRDLSAPTLPIKQIYRLINKGWLESLMEKISEKPLPIVTSFFVPAFVGDHWHYKHDVFCLVTDTDMSRSWVALDPSKSNIKYFAPTQRVVERLKLYGIKEKNIFLTGFPLPKQNIGGPNMTILKKDIGRRLYNLDPSQNYFKKYKSTAEYHLGSKNIPKRQHHPLTITFAVGGAGAQKELGSIIVRKLKKHVANGTLRIILVAGIRNEVYNYFKDVVTSNGLKKYFGTTIDIVYEENKTEYFKQFNKILRTTDILWTKPSELSFYSGLGLPIIMAQSIGSQEDFNRSWLKAVGAGITQNDPQYVDEWLWDWLESGWLAKAAMEGFLYAPKMGTYNIEEILLHRHLKIDQPTLIY